VRASPAPSAEKDFWVAKNGEYTQFHRKSYRNDELLDSEEIRREPTNGNTLQARMGRYILCPGREAPDKANLNQKRPGGRTQNDVLTLSCCPGFSGLMIRFLSFRGLAAPAEVVSGLQP
jgi:hypothetical protein